MRTLRDKGEISPAGVSVWGPREKRFSLSAPVYASQKGGDNSSLSQNPDLRPDL